MNFPTCIQFRFQYANNRGRRFMKQLNQRIRVSYGKGYSFSPIVVSARPYKTIPRFNADRFERAVPLSQRSPVA